ncbi:hypothetical protein [Streptomyces sp. NPDC058092]|uniref:hypothetical protein n=1 Tax=Streptomyces sp. NPDC058092 TaxID=3346336 RepID=UPI0036E60D24
MAGFEFPDAGCDNDLFALSEPGTYAIESGTPTVMAAPHTADLPIESDRALPTRTFGVHDFGAHVTESQVPHSTALHSLVAPVLQRPPLHLGGGAAAPANCADRRGVRHGTHRGRVHVHPERVGHRAEVPRPTVVQWRRYNSG